MKRMRLNDVYSGALTGNGIFSDLQSFDVPWKNDGIASELDLEYFGNISGDKFISPLVRKLLDDGELSAIARANLCKAALALYLTSWEREYATIEAEYDPIENYSMIEQMTNDTTRDVIDRTNTRTNNLSHTKTGSESDAPNLTNTERDKTFGFNSSSAVDANEKTTTATGTASHTYNTTDADTGTQTDRETADNSRTRNYRLTRSGNIGVTTSQQMLESERALWLWSFFRDVVFPDLDKILTLSVY